MRSLLSLALFAALILPACSGGSEPPPNGLLLSMAVLKKSEHGRPIPQPAQLGILYQDGHGWQYSVLEDPDSNVFHKAMAYEPSPGHAGLLTLGGTRAILKLWRKGEQEEVIWEQDFGGTFSRMRDAEVADIYGDGSPSLVVATHDQGVVAVVTPSAAGGYRVEELDRQPDQFVHEIEVGDLNDDGTLEIYATPSARNVLDGTPQPGSVTRYVPAAGQGAVVVAELGDRHAKEILVDDLDGDGVDELYVSVEAISGGRVEIRRYDAGTPPQAAVVIAELDDKLCRFLTAGDINGDGRKEMVAAASKSGLWLLRPADAHGQEWAVELIDSDSFGFEHAAILCDLDENGVDELYVASDKHGEVRRYVWEGGEPKKEVIYAYPGGLDGFTWNIMPAPVELLPMMRRMYLGGMLILLAACSGLVDDGLPAQPHPIILIDIGTLRADHLGCYGYERNTSPNIDALAAESARFEWTFGQAPNTAPAQASLFTGLYPGTHGMASEGARLPAEATTLAEALAERGYVTAAFVDGGYLSTDFGLDQGFQTYDNSRGAGLSVVGPKAIAWLEKHASEDFLLLVHTYDTHTPYSPPDSHRDLFLEGLALPSEDLDTANAPEYAKALYDAEIRFVDDWIGRILKSIRDLGLHERATVVLVADHGEEFMEHGSVSHETLYSTVTRVPMMVRLPGGRAAATISGIVETIDLMPTLLELAGTPQPAGIQGQSLLPMIQGEGEPPYLAFGESSFFGGQRFAAMGGYHLILSTVGDEVELYNFLDDPLELEDLSADEPDRVEVLRRKLGSWEEMVARATLGQEAAPLDEDTLEQLKSLGYVQ